MKTRLALISVLFACGGRFSRAQAPTPDQFASCRAVYENVYTTGRHTYLKLPTPTLGVDPVTGVTTMVNTPDGVTIRGIALGLQAVIAALKSGNPQPSVYTAVCSDSTVAWVTAMKSTWSPATGYSADTLAALAARVSALQSIVAP